MVRFFNFRATVVLCGFSVFVLISNAFGSSDDVLKLLKTKSYWISVTLVKTPQGDLFPIILKKWSIQGTDLVELTQNSVRKNSSGEKEWMSERVALSSDIPYDRIATFPLNNPTMSVISKSAFILSSNEVKVLFRESNGDSQLLPSVKGSFQHMWAPVAATMADLGLSSSWDPLPPVPHPKRTPLRHDLSKIRKVRISSRFPRSLIPSVENALNEWNRALRKPYYQIVDLKSDYSAEKCLSENDLCIHWSGSEKLSWAGYGAIAIPIYDPAVGYILGGVISIHNTQTQEPNEDPPADLLKQLDDPKAGPYLAGAIWAQESYRYFKNPDPVGSITALLVHELGHDQGLRHYFGGSLHSQPGIPSDTVMDYMPYPYFNKMQKLRDRDLAKIESIYFDGNFGSGFSREMPCADKDVLMNPLCNPQDIGDPAIFYSSLMYGLGPFHEVKPVGGILGVFNGPQPVVRFAARYLVPNPNVTTLQRMIVQQTICSSSEKDKVIQYLLTLASPVRLYCDGTQYSSAQ